ncbi:MAG: hypothetical protein WC473_03810 [Patescibacteria group bacterium]
MNTATGIISHAEPQTVEDLMALVKQHATWARNLQARVDAVQNDQKLLAEQLIKRIKTGESLGDKILDFLVRQEDLLVTWLTDGGRLEHNLRELDEVISKNAGQTVMLAMETVEERTIHFKYDYDVAFSYCLPQPSFIQTCYYLILGNLRPGGLLIEGERWFLPMDDYTYLNPSEEERRIMGNIPLPSPDHLFNSSACPMLELGVLLGWHSLGAKKEQVKILVGVAEIRQWLGKCENEQLCLRVLEILDELETAEPENKESDSAPQEPSPES